jgi:flavodoxin I
MSKTAIFYSPEGGSVNRVAIELGEMIGNEKVVLIPVKKAEKEDITKYSQLIFVGSTVGADHWSNETVVNEWPGFFSMVDEISFEDKKAAIVGLGNSVLYPEHFADGMAHLYKQLSDKNANIYGFVDAEGYTFEDSEALNDEGLFCGLPLDEDNEEELTAERLEHWISRLKPDFDFS